MLNESTRGSLELYLLLISLGITILALVLFKVELLNLNIEKNLTKHFAYEQSARKNLIAAIAKKDGVGFRNSEAISQEVALSNETSLVYSHSGYIKLGAIISATKLPNWSFLFRTPIQKRCTPVCQRKILSFNEDTHIRGNLDVNHLVLEGVKNKTALRISVKGNLRILEELHLKNFSNSTIELIVSKNIDIDRIRLIDSDTSSLLLHSSLGEVGVKQSNILGCLEESSKSEILFSQIKKRCRYDRNNIIWPKVRILGESQEKLYTLNNSR